ncbi:hypothetical protein [Lysinibacillus sp. NPDC056232]|uniref:hypothetical protein n=1 Tax=Lysinibacillus sp. NPDC056232 TaxID=3345756 RepID=UPI0035D8A7CB
MLCELVDWSGGLATPWGLAAHRTPPGSFALCESVATAIVLSVRKRSDSNNKAPSRNGNQPLVLP